MLNFYFGAGEAVFFGQSDCLTAARLKNACGIHSFFLILMVCTNDGYHFDSLQARFQSAFGESNPQVPWQYGLHHQLSSDPTNPSLIGV